MMMGRDRRQRRRRAAVVGGAAIAAKKHHDAKQAEEEAAARQPTAAAPEQAPPATGLSPEAMGQLKQLGELHDQNVLSDEEFEREKGKLLGPA
jgi:hypothetical protein